MSERRQIRVTGRVQGVGFRAFVRALATDLGLTGFVRNDGRDVFLEAQGDPVQLEKLLSRLQTDHPRAARVENVASETIPPISIDGFRIEPTR